VAISACFDQLSTTLLALIFIQSVYFHTSAKLWVSHLQALENHWVIGGIVHPANSIVAKAIHISLKILSNRRQDYTLVLKDELMYQMLRRLKGEVL
jgi:hypothetical protein